MSLEIHLAKVGIGDCILIRMGREKRKVNLLIDSGKNDDGYRKTTEYIRNNLENIDYMMITHDDDDHIMGIFNTIVLNKQDDILCNQVNSLFSEKRVFANYWKKGSEELLDYKKMGQIGKSFRDKDIDLQKLEYIVADPKNREDESEVVGLNMFQILWKVDESGEFVSEIRKVEEYQKNRMKNGFPTADGEWEHAEILILSPTRDTLRTYVDSAWKKYKRELDESEVLFAGKKKDKDINEWDYSIQQLYDHPIEIKEDDSKVNNASISFLLFYNGTTSLFAGDSKPSDMIETAKRYLEFLGESKQIIPLDFMKMPHHASSHNNSLEFIKMFPTKYYLISTKGHNGYKHPGKQTMANIAKVHQKDKESFILCNYHPWTDGNIRFKDKEYSWNTQSGECKVKISEDERVVLHFVELKSSAYKISNDTSEEILVSL